MSNVFNSNPIALDSVMAATAKNTAGTPWNSGFRFLIKAIMWDVQAAGAGKAVSLQDGLANVIYSGSTTSPSLPQPISLNPPLYVADFKLAVIGGGVLYLYLA
jgi:hypothetical protein